MLTDPFLDVMIEEIPLDIMSFVNGDDISLSDASIVEEIFQKETKMDFSNNYAGKKSEPTNKGATSSNLNGLHEWDVLLGRSQKIHDFIGNVRFRSLIQSNANAYQMAERNAEKTRVSRTIYNTIVSQGGRFLDKMDMGEETSEWFEISKDKGVAKICQALRMYIRRRHGKKTKSTKPSSYPSNLLDQGGSTVVSAQRRSVRLASPLDLGDLEADFLDDIIDITDDQDFEPLPLEDFGSS